jgi:hypothetical protein
VVARPRRVYQRERIEHRSLRSRRHRRGCIRKKRQNKAIALSNAELPTYLDADGVYCIVVGRDKGLPNVGKKTRRIQNKSIVAIDALALPENEKRDKQRTKGEIAVEGVQVGNQVPRKTDRYPGSH